MADSLALSITVPLDRLPEFAASLDAHLEPDTPCAEQDLLALAVAGKELALTLRFPPDLALAEFRDEHPDIQCSVPEEVAVGYLFSTAREVTGGVKVTFYTSSRAIVQVLKASVQVRAMFVRLGRLGTPPAVRVTDEWNDVHWLGASVA